MPGAARALLGADEAGTGFGVGGEGDLSHVAPRRRLRRLRPQVGGRALGAVEGARALPPGARSVNSGRRPRAELAVTPGLGLTDTRAESAFLGRGALRRRWRSRAGMCHGARPSVQELGRSHGDLRFSALFPRAVACALAQRCPLASAARSGAPPRARGRFTAARSTMRARRVGGAFEKKERAAQAATPMTSAKAER